MKDPVVEMLEVLVLMRKDPMAAADRLDVMAERLKALARTLRAGVANNKCTGGTNDRVQMTVVGPDGTIKQTTDTGSVS